MQIVDANHVEQKDVGTRESDYSGELYQSDLKGVSTGLVFDERNVEQWHHGEVLEDQRDQISLKMAVKQSGGDWVLFVENGSEVQHERGGVRVEEVQTDEPNE